MTGPPLGVGDTGITVRRLVPEDAAEFAAVGAALAVFTFAAVIFTALALLWLKEPKSAPAERVRSRLSGAMLIVCAVWFYLNLFIELLETTPGPVRPEPYLLLMALAFWLYSIAVALTRVVVRPSRAGPFVTAADDPERHAE